MVKRVIVGLLVISNLCFADKFDDIDKKYHKDISKIEKTIIKTGLYASQVMAKGKEGANIMMSNEFEDTREILSELNRMSIGAGYTNLKNTLKKHFRDTNDIKNYEDFHKDIVRWYCGSGVNDITSSKYKVSCGLFLSGLSSEEFHDKWYNGHYKPLRDEKERLRDIERKKEQKKEDENRTLANEANNLRKDIINLCRSKFTVNNVARDAFNSSSNDVYRMYGLTLNIPISATSIPDEYNKLNIQRYKEGISTHKSKGQTLCMLYEFVETHSHGGGSVILNDVETNPNEYTSDVRDMLLNYKKNGKSDGYTYTDLKDDILSSINYYKESLNIIDNSPSYNYSKSNKEESVKQEKKSNQKDNLRPNTNSDFSLSKIEIEKPKFNKQEGISKITKVENDMKEKVNQLSSKIEFLQKENNHDKANQLLSDGKVLMNRYDVLGKNLKSKYSDITQDYVEEYLDKTKDIIQDLDNLLNRN